MKNLCLLALALSVSLLWLGCSSPSETKQEYSLFAEVPIDAKTNCIPLASSAAARTTLASGTYPLRVWGTTGARVCAVFASDAPTPEVRIFWPGYDFQITVGRDSFFYAFFTRTPFASDTASSVTFDFGTTTMTVTARDNSISLDSIAAFVDLPPGKDYSAGFSGSAILDGQTPANAFYYQYSNFVSDITTISVGYWSFRTNTRLYFFLVDPGPLTDNSGTITANVLSKLE